MTLVNILVESDHARIYTDGALINPADNVSVVGFTSKVMALPHLDAIMATSGTVGASLNFYALIGSLSAIDFDDLADRIEAAVTPIAEHFAGAILFLVGWSERGKRMRGFIMNHEAMGNRPPFARQDIGEFLMPRPLNECLGTADMIALVESQRANADRPQGLPPAHVVGCFLQETIVAKEGSKTRIIHRWPDVMGEKIEPLAEKDTATMADAVFEVLAIDTKSGRFDGRHNSAHGL